MSEKRSREHNSQDLSNDQIARRRLLTIAAYVPPAILGVMIAGNKIAEAGDEAGAGGTIECGSGSIVISAGGAACCPCVPGDKRFNPTKCAWEKCKLGNCSACPPGPYSRSNCNKVARACGCTCRRGKRNHGGSNRWDCN